MTRVDIDHVEAVALAATPDGNWGRSEYCANDFELYLQRGDGGHPYIVWHEPSDAPLVSAITGNGPTSAANAKFYAGARGCVLAMIAELRAARAVLALCPRHSEVECDEPLVAAVRAYDAATAERAEEAGR